MTRRPGSAPPAGRAAADRGELRSDWGEAVQDWGERLLEEVEPLIERLRLPRSPGEIEAEECLRDLLDVMLEAQLSTTSGNLVGAVLEAGMRGVLTLREQVASAGPLGPAWRALGRAEGELAGLQRHLQKSKRGGARGGSTKAAMVRELFAQQPTISTAEVVRLFGLEDAYVRRIKRNLGGTK